MKFTREDIIRETALIQRGLTRISKSPLNIVNYFVLGIGIFIIITIAQDDFFFGPNQKGLVVLSGLTACNFIFIFLYSFAYFSRVISEEKESRTMTLLRLTPVKPTNIFFGKLLPPFINLIQILIFQIPLVILVITLGGVSMNQVLSIYLMLLLTSSFFAVIGVWASSNNLENWLAYFNFLFMTFLVALAYGGIQMMRYQGSMKEFANYLANENPFIKSYHIMFVPQTEIFHTALVYSILIFTGLFLAYKSFLRNLDIEDYGNNENKVEAELKAKSINFGNFPILQKEYYFGCGGKKGQTMVFILLILMGTLFYFSEKTRYSAYQVPSVITNIVLLQIGALAIFLIYIIGNSFKKELKENTWDNLLISPMSASQIINQKVLGGLKFITPLAAALIILMLLNYKVLSRDFKYFNREFPSLWILPASYCAVISVFIYFQLFDKFSTIVISMFVGGTLSFLIMTVSKVQGDELIASIIAVNILMGATAFIMYHLAAKTIDNQINLKSRD